MIDLVEIRDADRVTIGVIDAASSIIWHSVYNGVGDFEIYCKASDPNVVLLQIGNYVTRPNNDEVGIIEHINVTFNYSDGYMITATGRFAKSLLDRRLIYTLSGKTNTPTIIRGNVEIAMRQLVKDNAIDCSFDSRRNIPILGLAALQGLTPIIVDENGNAARKQVSYKNLLDYTEKVLREYGLAAKIILNNSNKKLLYQVYQGTDRSSGNTEGNEAIIFSLDYDNLVSSEYDYSEESLKNSALIGGEGEGLERFYTLLTKDKSALELREIFVDASSINKTYTDDNDEEQEYTDAEYREMLNQQGMQALDEHLVTETFSGEINATHGAWQYERDYQLGDIVTVQDNLIGIYINVRITEVTEVQDENGYSVNVVFGE